MPDKPFKAFERDIATILGGQRFWANSGEALDVEAPGFVAQCKLVKRLSLSELCDLAELVERQATPKFKAGVVAVRLRRGAGRRSTTLMVVTDTTWKMLHGSVTAGPAR